MSSPEYKKERYEWLKSHKICAMCGAEPIYKNTVLCIRCRAVRNAASAEYKRKHPDTEKQKEKRKLKARETRNERKANGQCPECGRQVNTGKIYCEYCLFRMSKRRKNKRRENGIYSKHEKFEMGFCYWCGKNKLEPGQKLCQSCYDKSLKSLEKARTCIKSGWRFEKFEFGKCNKN